MDPHFLTDLLADVVAVGSGGLTGLMIALMILFWCCADAMWP